MSRSRGVVPLLLATVIGIGNGIWIFGPAFKDQPQKNENKAIKNIETEMAVNNAELVALRTAEADASRAAATESALSNDTHSKSWWSGASLWARGSSSPGKAEPLPEIPEFVEEIKKEPPVS